MNSTCSTSKFSHFCEKVLFQVLMIILSENQFWLYCPSRLHNQKHVRYLFCSWYCYSEARRSFYSSGRKVRKLTFFLPLQKGFLNMSSGPIKESEDESNMEDLDHPTDFEGLPVRVDWNAELPANIVVPRVDIHSLILDFAAVSFLDISALKGLKIVSFHSSSGSNYFASVVFYFMFCKLSLTFCRCWESWSGLKLRSTSWLAIVSINLQYLCPESIALTSLSLAVTQKLLMALLDLLIMLVSWHLYSSHDFFPICLLNNETNTSLGSTLLHNVIKSFQTSHHWIKFDFRLTSSPYL